MTKILFYDDRFDKEFILFNNNPKFILDYFDIESQKILPIIRYSFKCNPQLLQINNTITSIDELFDFSCNINNPILFDRLTPINCNLGVIFECYK